MRNLYGSRVFVSFDGVCPMDCKHCYSFEYGQSEWHRDINELVDSIAGEKFDIIYLSQRYENFSDEGRGIMLCEALYERYHKDILGITRQCISDMGMERLAKLNRRMNEEGHVFYLAVSISARESRGIMENLDECPSAEKRLDTLMKAHRTGLKTLLMLRPIFPSSLVPIGECLGLIEDASGYADAVVSSGLIVTDSILGRLGLEASQFIFLEGGDSEYLADLQDATVRYADVEKELESLEECCSNRGIPFFRHSMPAVNVLGRRAIG